MYLFIYSIYTYLLLLYDYDSFPALLLLLFCSYFDVIINLFIYVFIYILYI